MRAGLVGTIVGAAVGIATVWSCSVERPSETLRCDENADCTPFPGTICTSGYCVRGMLPIDARELDAFIFVCPNACDSCDQSQTPAVCTITGTGSGSITCPPGLKCNVTCGQAGACGAINCGSAASCDVDCVADNACLGISCQTTNCDVTCTGSAACQNITCTTGNCVATCTGADACGNVTCQGGACSETCSGGNGSAVCGTFNCSGSGACTRSCTGSNACGSMQCANGPCTETCSGGSNACGTINCGNGKCQATCQGTDSACGDVQCTNSCQCDVMCDDVTNTCPTLQTCPDPNGMPLDACEDLVIGRCDSTKTPNKCQVCP